MARQVSSKRKKTAAKPKKTVNYEVISILLIAFGLVMGFSFFLPGSVGKVGEWLKTGLMGLFGAPAYLLSFIIIGASIHYMITRRSKGHAFRYWMLVILTALISVFWQLISEAPESVSHWANGVNGIGGGVIGGFVAEPLLSWFGGAGSMILVCCALLVLLVIVFHISVVSVCKGIYSWVRDVFAFEVDIGEDEPEPDKVSTRKKTAKKDEVPAEIERELKEIKQKIFDFEKEFGEDFPSKKGGAQPEEAPQNEVLATQEPDEEKLQEAIEAATEEALLPKKQKKEEKIEQMEIEVESTHLDYTYPSLSLLTEPKKDDAHADESLERMAKKMIETLASFHVEAKITDYSRGPAITRYELQPSAGVKISKITSLADDIALNLAVSGVRIEPIPGKTAIGIEVPNESQSTVHIRELIGSGEFANFSSKLAFALGKDIGGRPVICDIARMPHLLIAGSTGSGKSVCINSLIASILYKASPNEVKLVLVDPKVVELGVYNGIPHLLIPVVTDPRKAAGALQWAVNEMTNRYKLFADNGVRDLKGYNAMVRELQEKNKDQEDAVLPEELPQIVIVIDELADLMMVAPHDVEDSICRLAQMARAAGMHLVIATQRPSVDVITGLIKANVPSRIAFAVSSYIDSRTILDASGAEKLLGRGDMLYRPIGASKPQRLQGPFVSDKEVEAIVTFVKGQNIEIQYDQDVLEQIENAGEQPVANENHGGEADELLPQAVEMAIEAGQASVAMYQRRLKVGYQRAARLIDQMEQRKIIGPFDGTKPREVLVTKAQWNEMMMNMDAIPMKEEEVPKPWDLD